MKVLLIPILIFFPLILFSQKKLPDVPGTIFWKVYPRNNPAKVSFIIGTNHSYGGSFIDTLPLLKKRVLEAELFICESAQSGTSAEPPVARPNYRALMTPDDYSMVDKYLLQHGFVGLEQLDSAGFPLHILLVTVAADKMSSLNGSKDPDEKIMDSYLAELARNAGIAILSLDSGYQFKDETMGFIGNNKLLAGHLVNFVRAVESRDTTVHARLRTADMKQWNVHYRFNRDAREDAGRMAQELTIERNKYWLPKLISSLERKRCFVAVGIGHLMYQSSLLHSLMERGFVVRPVMRSELR